MINKSKNSIIYIVTIATIFGLAAGVVGSLVTKSYFGTSSNFWGEYDFVNGDLNKPRLVISGAKKVVVAQDERIGEVISQVSNSLLSIYQKKATSSSTLKPDLNNFYKKGDEIGTALIVTSDGWIVTDALVADDFSEKNIEKSLEKYVLIGKNKEIYTIDKASVDKQTGYIFLHVNARDLPVIKIATVNNLKSGETVFALNSTRNNFVSNVFSSLDYSDYQSISSDFFYNKISLVNDLPESLYSSFLYNISGEVVSFVNKKGEFIPASVFNSVFESLFNDGEIVRPSMGLYYSDLSFFINSNENERYLDNGAFVNPSPRSSLSPWMEAGIKVGDVIKTVNGQELDEVTSLSSIVMSHSSGDVLKIGLIRDLEEMEVEVVLESLK